MNINLSPIVLFLKIPSFCWKVWWIKLYLRTWATLEVWILTDGIAGHSLKARISGAGVPLAKPAVALVSGGTGAAHWSINSVAAVNSWRSFKAGIGNVGTFGFLHLTSLAILKDNHYCAENWKLKECSLLEY